MSGQTILRSGQELRLAAFLSQDKTLLDAYAHNKDAYAIIASQVFNMPYEDCLEFYPEGTELEIDGKKVIAGNKTHLNVDGKARRSVGKTMVLAGNYGMSGAGAGSLMGKTAKEGTELLDKYFKMFSGLKNAIDDSKENLKKNGYVEDIAGRRRRLPDIYLKPYEATYKDPNKLEKETFNPFISCKDRPVNDKVLNSYVSRAQACRNNKDYEALSKEALANGVILQAYTGRIAQAERQCFNARIQGSAGTLTKKAMIDIFNDEKLKEWDAHLIVTVHDEVLVECKEEFAEQVADRLPKLMIAAAEELGIQEPKMKCDPYLVSRWYSDTMAGNILKEYSKAKEKGLSSEEAINKVIENHSELPKEAIIKTVETGCDLEF
ncbi:DNA polymerase [Intestinibacter sp.]|uniref:DNA polymerase n=1 Tax=Intestinibacter sp. TaxID=1965304 RepID=UPI002A761828|nr:DNA polymerase [Intestinibacter sp.]MDY2735933.1 DNA polymerase [Intestinibacter sp.]